ncbi:MAG TPA: amino acid adenylation domain-containing protein, partial [Longimicrobiaceae bacterium]|nr:amino acid adenylation domain-containing protein [Longimicrobiaceae bacterium]
QYADFAAWQRARLTGRTLEELVGYWRGKLAGAPPLLEVPTDAPRAARRSAAGASHRLTLPAEAAGGLRALARGEGATLFMALLAGWQALLGRWAGEDDVVVGSPAAGRTRPETEGLIGFFVNMLPLRGDLSGDPTWAELLGRVRETALEAYAHQELPFERLVEEVATDRGAGHAPVFQAALDLQRPTPAELLRLGPVRMEPLPPAGVVAKFDLDLTVVEDGETLEGTLVYPAELFEAATAGRMAAHLRATLETMAGDPRGRLSGLSLLDAAERAQLLGGWSGPAAETPPAFVHDLFAEQAARTPDAPAVVAPDAELTYAELDRAANRLARHLRGLGAGPETRVGVCMERGAGLVVALLGVLKAGGVYLPLDPATPPERLAYVLADAGAAALVAAPAFADALAGFGGAWVDPERDAAAIAGAGDEAPAVALSPENAAYVIYTSGSTGGPKGVEVAHAGAAGLLRHAVEAFGAGPGCRVLQTASIGFDASLLEVFVALLSGAALHVAGRDAVLSPYRLGALLREREVDVWMSTPALLDTLPDADFPALRTVSTGGERCSAQTAARWSAGRRLLNMSGPTETTIYVTAHLCEPGAAVAPPIGRPVADARVYVLDRWGQPLPAGVPGEVHVGGGAVARGYLGRPALTAERFVPDPFTGVAGSRMYRTGDRARRLPSGELEFLGRLDQQVKVRGVRIEPGEVEAALCEHPAVREAVVVPYEESPGRRRLVAYLVPAEGASVSRAELRDRLRARLPEPLVPATFVEMEAFPLTPSGKVDRRALPAPRLSPDTEYVAPRTPTEEVLCGIYAEVLQAERVGVHHNFFDLGGHSLLAARVVSRVAEALGIELPLRTVFEAPSAATLAERLQSAVPGGGLPAPDLEGEIARIAELSDEEVLRLIGEG